LEGIDLAERFYKSIGSLMPNRKDFEGGYSSGIYFGVISKGHLAECHY